MLTQELMEQVLGRPVRVRVSTMLTLMLYAWPGGHAELRDELEKAAQRAAGHPIEPGHLSPAITAHLPRAGTPLLPWFHDEVEAAILHWAVRHSGVSKAELARELGITRPALYKKLHRYGFSNKY